MRVASRSFASLLVAAALLGGCGPKRIPGTDIKDSPETRAVGDVIEQYRLAVERRDPNAVLALVSRKYFDNAGTTDPAAPRSTSPTRSWRSPPPSARCSWRRS